MKQSIIKVCAGKYEYKGFTMEKYDDPSGYAHVRTPPYWFVKDSNGNGVYKTSTKTDCIWYIDITTKKGHL